MKKSAAILALILCAAATLVAQTPLIPTKAGVELKYEQKDAKGVVTGYTVTRVADVRKVPEGIVVTLNTTGTKTNGAENPEMPAAGYEVLVTDSRVIYSKDGMVPPAGDLDVEVSVEGDDIVYPLNPVPGDKLPPYTITIAMRANHHCSGEDCDHEHHTGDKKGKGAKSMTLSSVERTVTKTETITVPAGTFQCVVITEVVKARAMMGLFNHTSRSVTWFAPGVGEVQSHELDKRGRVESTSQLISMTAGK